MVDFKLLRQQMEDARIIEKLDKLGVPDEGTLSWFRLTKFAQQYAGWDFKEAEPETPQAPTEITLSEDQASTWVKLLVWVQNEEPYFLLRGFAGTGKSFLMKKLKDLNVDLFFTAPTNKATKVLSRFVETEAKTTFSQLGLRMSTDDENLVMEYGKNNPYLPKGSILIIDECSMVGTQLYDFIEETRRRTGCKVLYVGDPAQLPPVKEKRSRSWTCTEKRENIATLRKVMRYDNQLLKLATRIRQLMKDRNYDTYPIENDHEETGVFVLKSQKRFIKELMQWSKPDDFLTRKVIAWRNKTVTNYNNIIREHFGFNDPYNVGDIILLAEPIEKNEVIIGHIDDEFKVKDVVSGEVATSCKTIIPIWQLKIENEDGVLLIRVPKNREDIDEVLAEKASKARNAHGVERRDLWRDFWDTKKIFAATRYGYSITSHRSQGSTFETVFLDQCDVLSNPNKREAMKCLYVAATRASKDLYSF